MNPTASPRGPINFGQIFLPPNMESGDARVSPTSLCSLCRSVVKEAFVAPLPAGYSQCHRNGECRMMDAPPQTEGGVLNYT